jgi:hypothetical protein
MERFRRPDSPLGLLFALRVQGDPLLQVTLDPNRPGQKCCHAEKGPERGDATSEAARGRLGEIRSVSARAGTESIEGKLTARTAGATGRAESNERSGRGPAVALDQTSEVLVAADVFQPDDHGRLRL